ncbi:MAG TPA: V-type ATP synthase subunit E [bacterium]|nr:V-type ATP synthase subunit E [bacterium]
MGSELARLLEGEARVEKDKVLAEARARAEELLAAARKDAEELAGATRRRLENERAQAKTRAASAASLKAAAMLLEAKDTAIQAVFDRAAAELKRMSEDPARRRAMLRTLLTEAAQGLETQGGTLDVPPGDAGIAQEVAKAMGLSVEIRETPEVIGGVRLTTRDRRIMVENTLASRLSRARAALVSRVAGTLWGK